MKFSEAFFDELEKLAGTFKEPHPLRQDSVDRELRLNRLLSGGRKPKVYHTKNNGEKLVKVVRPWTRPKPIKGGGWYGN